MQLMTHDQERGEEQHIIGYLLGTLSEKQTEQMEERLVCNPSFLARLSRVEGSLICRYLGRALPPDELAAFEKKYLRIPELAKRVAVMRQMRAAAEDHSLLGMGVPFRVAIAATAMVLCALGGFLVGTKAPGHQRLNIAPEPAVAQSTGKPDNLVIFKSLNPGLAMSSSERPQRVTLTSVSNEIRLSFELPGLHGRIEPSVQIFQVGERGRRLIWSHDKVPSVDSQGGQALQVSLSKSELSVGDYIAYLKRSAADPDRDAIESYSFGVVRQQEFQLFLPRHQIP
jgi:hypothetical protein